VKTLLAPPIAFLLYIPLVLLIVRLGKRLAGPAKPNAVKSSVYGSGEVAPEGFETPGYRPFVLVAFFFAFLHLGILVLGTGTGSGVEVLYVAGLLLGLVALILG
jgi:NADH:ubiquinone oxidoreductase subunit 3 (subunit A)